MELQGLVLSVPNAAVGEASVVVYGVDAAANGRPALPNPALCCGLTLGRSVRPGAAIGQLGRLAGQSV
jgi:hypothetical protein